MAPPSSARVSPTCRPVLTAPVQKRRSVRNNTGPAKGTTSDPRLFAVQQAGALPRRLCRAAPRASTTRSRYTRTVGNIGRRLLSRPRGDQGTGSTVLGRLPRPPRPVVGGHRLRRGCRDLAGRQGRRRRVAARRGGDAKRRLTGPLRRRLRIRRRLRRALGIRLSGSSRVLGAVCLRCRPPGVRLAAGGAVASAQRHDGRRRQAQRPGLGTAQAVRGRPVRAGMRRKRWPASTSS